MGKRLKKSFGRRVYEISEKLGIPRATVERVIKEYLNSLIESAVSGEDIVIDNIMSIKIMEDINGDLVARGRVSSALQMKLRNMYQGV